MLRLLMNDMKHKNWICRGLLLAGIVLGPMSACAWDYETHRLINQLALATLPTNFPAFVTAPDAVERIGFLAGEADRWRNTPDLALKHCNNPDHYLDLEELPTYGLTPDKLPVFRYDFVANLALFRKANPEKFPKVDGRKNPDHTDELIGLLPWSIVESYGKVKSGFSYLRAFQENGGTAEEIANAQANLIYVMGVMGHWVGDAAQPLHTTIHHHGWVGENPNGYSTNRNIHSWIDGGFFGKTGQPMLAEMKPRLRPARLVARAGEPVAPSEMFRAAVDFISRHHAQVETLYRLEKEHKLGSNREASKEGRAFLENQVLQAAQFLGDIWFSAWQQAPPDKFLIDRLNERK
jgi:hypothetical protein